MRAQHETRAHQELHSEDRVGETSESANADLCIRIAVNPLYECRMGKRGWRTFQ